MPTLEVSTRELAILKRAVEVQNDILNDTFLDNTTVNLFPQNDDVTVITKENSKQLREELHDTLTELQAMQRLMLKLGCTVNDLGYSI